MRANSWFTDEERADIDTYLPELRHLKRLTALRTSVVDEVTQYSMSIVAELRLRIIRDLYVKYPEFYRNMKDPKTFFRVTTLDSRLGIYLENRLRDIQAVESAEPAQKDATTSTTKRKAPQQGANMKPKPKAHAVLKPRTRAKFLTVSKTVTSLALPRLRRPSRITRNSTSQAVATQAVSAPTAEGEGVVTGSVEINGLAGASTVARDQYTPFNRSSVAPSDSFFRTPWTRRLAFLPPLGVPEFD